MIYKYGVKSVVFTEEVIQLFNKYKQIDKKQHESGGILLGKIYNDLIIIDQISEPSIEDKSGLFHFYRNVKKAQKITEQAWKESNGERIYLGEWHTHPQDNPIPSSDDKKLIANMLKYSRMEIDFLFMIIIGRISPYVAVLEKGMKAMIAMKKINAENGLNIIFYKNESKQINGFQASGYLNIAQKGYDIYNAAFSQIFFGTISSLQMFTNLQKYILEHETAFIRFIIPDIEKEDVRVITLLDAMEVQVSMLIEEMKNKGLEHHVSINIKEIF